MIASLWSSQRTRVRAGFAAVGALVGVLIVWLRGPDPATCVLLDDGARACMPVLVMPAPWWAYVVAGAVGVVVGLLLAQAVLALVHRLDPRPGEDSTKAARTSGRMAG